MGKILVVGSSNTDMVIEAQKLPRAGETILGTNFFMSLGGKGANQAVACARLNGAVKFACKIGDDVFSNQTMAHLKSEGIDASYIAISPGDPSGVALIFVDKSGENCIGVAAGANNKLSPSDITDAMIEESDIVLMQLEVPIATIEDVAVRAKKMGKTVILNPAPAPAQPLSDTLMKCIDIITPNETEAEVISGVHIDDENSINKAAQSINNMGTSEVIITLGSKGALLYDGSSSSIYPSQKVEVVDTTAAGDCFNGALAVALSNGEDMAQAIRFANKCAALSVMKLGAQPSLPYLKDIEN